MKVNFIGDGMKCEEICRHAPPSKKWPCEDCDMRWHDRAEPLVSGIRSKGDAESVEQLESITGYRYEWFYRDGKRVCEPVRNGDEFVPAPYVAFDNYI